jgi:hypothetical protein
MAEDHKLTLLGKKDESSHLSFVKICKYAGFLLTLAGKNVDRASKPMMLALDPAPMGTIATSTSSNPGSPLLAPVLSRSIPI